LLEKAMLRRSVTLTCVALTLTAGIAGADVYKFKDENGNVLYTDKPATLPAERMNMQSRSTNTVEVQARQEAELKRMQEADQTRKQGTTQQSEQKAANDVTAKDKADRCVKARERYEKYMTSQRLYNAGEGGERRYLSDAEMDAARSSAKSTMDELCK
jgi:Domain of unknown function (DUF4124)